MYKTLYDLRNFHVGTICFFKNYPMHTKWNPKCGLKFFILMFFSSGNYQKEYFAQIKMILQKFHEGKFQTKNKVDIKTNLQCVINLHKIT